MSRSYLQPVCDLDVELVESLDPVVEGIDGLHGLEMGLFCRPSACHHQTAPASRELLSEGKLTSMAGYSVRARSSMVAQYDIASHASFNSKIGLLALQDLAAHDEVVVADRFSGPEYRLLPNVGTG